MRVKRKEIDELAKRFGFIIHKECGGYRIVKDNKDIFPNIGICPVTTKRECLTFLKGCLWMADHLEDVKFEKRFSESDNVLIEGEVVADMKAGSVVRIKNVLPKPNCVFIPHAIMKRRKK